MRSFAAIISDVFFFTVCAFAISFTLLRYYFERTAEAVTFAAAIATATCLLTLLYLTRARRKNRAAAFNKRQLKALKIYLCTCDEETIFKLFENALGGTYARANEVLPQKEGVIFNFKFAPLTPDDAASAIKAQIYGKSKLYCCRLSEEAATLLRQFKVEFLELDGIYALFNEKNCLPTDELERIMVKPEFLSKIKERFTRKLFGPLTLSGLTFLVYSRFALYSVWYSAAGCIMLALAAVCLFIKRR